MAGTTIAVGSNGAALPQATINVAATAAFTTSGTIYVKTTAGMQLVTYSGTGGTTFTGCSGGTGTMATGNIVFQTIDQGSSIIFKRNEDGFSPAVVSTDQTANLGSAYSINAGWSNNLSGDNSTHGSNRFGQFFGTWPIRNASGDILNPPSGATPYFQMVGFYTVGGVYESFVVTGTPASPTVINPNTGHTLVSTYVSSYWAI